MTTVTVIQNEADHALALERLEALIFEDREEDVPLMDALALLIEDYEKRMHPIPPVSPTDAILFRMEQLGMSKAELARATHIGRGHISEILSGRRGMSNNAMLAFHKCLNIPFEVLFGVANGDQNGERHQSAR